MPTTDINQGNYDHNKGQEDRAHDRGYNPPCSGWPYEIGGRNESEQQRRDDYNEGWENHENQTS